jgi:type I restriction enzyme S subunit
MELKDSKNYKKTDVGMIPSDWEAIKLNLLSRSISSGKSNTKSELGSFPLYGSTGIIGSKSYNDYEGFKILVARVGANAGTVNKVEGKYCVSDNTLMITLNNNVSFDFIFFQLIKTNLNSLVFGSGQPLITGGQLKTIAIPLPPTLAEQTLIANALSDADALISSLEQLIAKKKLIKQGAMQQLLKPKKGWEVKKLGEVAEFTNGKGHEQFIDKTGEYIVVNSKFVSTEGEVFKTSSVNLCPLQKDDITIVMSDIPNGKALAKCFIVPKDNQYALNQRIGGIRPTNVHYKYLAYILNRNDYYLAFDSGSGQTNLRKNDVLDCPVDLPPTIEGQNEIATILSDMETEITSLETKLDKYRKIKQGMMQNLLTGKIRLV